MYPGAHLEHFRSLRSSHNNFNEPHCCRVRCLRISIRHIVLERKSRNSSRKLLSPQAENGIGPRKFHDRPRCFRKFKIRCGHCCYISRARASDLPDLFCHSLHGETSLVVYITATIFSRIDSCSLQDDIGGDARNDPDNHDRNDDLDEGESLRLRIFFIHSVFFDVPTKFFPCSIPRSC